MPHQRMPGPQISRRKLSRIATKLRNLRKFDISISILTTIGALIKASLQLSVPNSYLSSVGLAVGVSGTLIGNVSQGFHKGLKQLSCLYGDINFYKDTLHIRTPISKLVNLYSDRAKTNTESNRTPPVEEVG